MTLVSCLKTVSSSLACAGVLTAWAAYAEEGRVVGSSLKQLSLEELMQVKVVTATQIETDPFKLPFITQAFTRQDYERLLPRTLPQWLQEVPGVMVQKTANGQLSPYIRGFTGFRTLLLVDGIRLNNSTFREGPNQYWNTVDPLSVERLEIVKGPASVLYGSDAIGGTVNALSLSRHDYDPDPEANGGTFYRFSSSEDSHTGRAEFDGNLDDQLGLHLGGSLKSFGDLNGGAGVGLQKHTGYDEYDLDGKLDYSLRPNVKLTLAHQTVSQDDIWRTHSTIYGSTWHGLKPGSDLQRSADQQRQLFYLQLHATELPGFVETVRFSLSDQRQDEQQFRVRKDSRSERAGVDVDTLGAWLQLESPSPVGHWLYGVSFYHDWVDSFSRKFKADGSFDKQEIQGPVADDSTYDLIGAYVQNQLPSWGPVDFTVRGRYDHAQAEIGRMLDPVTHAATSFSKGWDSVVGSARAALHLDKQDHSLLFVGASQGFRAPNLSDLSRLDIAGSGQIETPSTSVEPEYYVMYEAGVKTRYKRFDLEAAYFYTDIQGMIIREPTGQLVDGLNEVTKRNSGEGYIQGVELEGHVHLLPGLMARGAFTWMEGELSVFPTTNPSVKETEPASRVMPMTGLLALRWEPEPRKFWAEAIYTVAAKQDQLSSSDRADVERIPPGGTPGYAVWTLRAGWRPHKHVALSAAIENLTDEDYRIHGSGINEPGRNFIIAGSLRF